MPRANDASLPFPAATLAASPGASAHGWRIPPAHDRGADGRVALADLDPGAKPFSQGSNAEDQARVQALAHEIDELQNLFYADGRHKLLLVLLPLTSPQGTEGYLTRISLLLHEHFGIESDMDSLGVKVMPFNLEPGVDRQELRNFLFNECGLNDQQVAV